MSIWKKLVLSFAVIAALAWNARSEEKAVLKFEEKPVLALTAPAGSKVTGSNGFVSVKATNGTVYIWLVRDAKSAETVIPRAAELIKSEFVNLKVTTTDDVQLNGRTFKHIAGNGNEADDNDPGAAEVFITKIGDYVFLACIHGEYDDATRERAPMMAVIGTARLPE